VIWNEVLSLFISSKPTSVQAIRQRILLSTLSRANNQVSNLFPQAAYLQLRQTDFFHSFIKEMKKVGKGS
jgi:hypothetical protein